MNSIFTYLLESNICLIIFYGIYYFLLRNETWFQLNRLVLLASVIAALFIPFIHYNIDVNVFINVANEGGVIIQEVINPNTNLIEDTTLFTFNNSLKLLFVTYLSGLFISFFVFIKRLNNLRELFKKGKQEKKNGVTYVLGNNTDLIFSFFSFIFINHKINSFSGIEYRRIIEHEMAHINGKHSLDIMFIELLKIIFWFNLAIYTYKQSLLQLHEYIAEQQVIKKDNDVLDYATFLVNQVKENTRVYSFGNHLFHGPIKNRLIMMNKFKSKKSNAIRMLSMFPALLGMMFYFGVEYREIPVNMEEEKAEVEIDPVLEDVAVAERDSTPPAGFKPPVLDFTPEKGKCYGKCTMSDEYIQTPKQYAVFTGDHTEGIELEELEITTSPAKQEWVKKKVDGACLSPVPNDCKVWCLVDIKAVYEKILVVKDITFYR
ncbi:MAG: hypothetical protein ACI94Y_000902 [Maribacter sp.]|jgi:hypothetical protein